MFLLTGNDFRCPVFSRNEMLVTLNNEPLFVCKPFATLGLDCHIKGYVIREVKSDLDWFCVKHSALVDPMPLSLYLAANGDNVIVPKHFLLV